MNLGRPVNSLTLLPIAAALVVVMALVAIGFDVTAAPAVAAAAGLTAGLSLSGSI